MPRTGALGLPGGIAGTGLREDAAQADVARARRGGAGGAEGGGTREAPGGAGRAEPGQRRDGPLLPAAGAPARAADERVLSTPLEPAPPEIARGREIWLKREDLHPQLGSFKWRGALPALREFRDERAARAVVTASTGNHGAATAWAARELGMEAIVFTPERVSETKLGRRATWARTSGNSAPTWTRRRTSGASSPPTPACRSSRTAPSPRSTRATARSGARSSTSCQGSPRLSWCP